MNLLSALTKRTGAATRAAVVLLGFALGPRRGPLALLSRSPVVHEVSYQADSDTIRADVYRPHDDLRHPGVIIVHGIAAQGKDDPRIRRLAISLASAGYVVLAPQLERLARGELSPSDREPVVAGFQYLCQQDYIVKQRVGMAGFCVSAALVLLAAEDQRISKQVAVVSSWGTYYDVRDLIEAVVTQSYTYRGETKAWKPAANIGPALKHIVIQLMPSSSDRAILTRLLEEEPPSQGDSSDPGLKMLSPSVQAVYRLFSGPHPDEVRALWPKLDPELYQCLLDLSPSSGIQQLQTKVVIVHGLGDGTVPYVESLKLSDALGDERRAYVDVFRFFDHVNPEMSRIRLSTLHKATSDIVKFYIFFYRILCQL